MMDGETRKESCPDSAGGGGSGAATRACPQTSDFTGPGFSMNSRQPAGRLSASFLLVVFLAQVAGGLASVLCESGMEHHPVSGSPLHAMTPPGSDDLSPPRADHGHHGSPTAHAGQRADRDGGADSCPLGAGALAFCGGAVPLTAPATPAPELVLSITDVAVGEAPDSTGILLVYDRFQPPRA